MLLKIYLLDIRDLPIEVLLNSRFISLKEKLELNKYNMEEVKKEKAASIYLKNKYIGRYYLNEFGKPISEEVCFNISHSHGLLALVIDKVNIGIDIEKIRNIEKDVIDYISSEKEKEYIKDEVSFYEIWTSKEALVKAEGRGIKEKISLIPSLPLNGVITYKDKTYRNVTRKYQDYILTVSRENIAEYDIEIIKEVIKDE